ncbi:MAG: magnesium transporter [Actinobacteria bacterium]|nr:magnesium transporter [Actinomycetota bacterium]MBW3641579.1 magnesium transporter [Actinomycetota bacterium]
MQRRRLHPLVRFRGLLGPDAAAARQSIVALALSTLTSLAAGATLGAITGTLERLPGLLVLVPASIGMRGNIFGALGSRLSTSIHTGTFGLSRRVDTVVGQNVVASGVLTLVTAVALAVLAKIVAVALGLPGTISVLDLVVISILGALLSSGVVLAFSLALASGSVRYGWDLDNVNAPLVASVGDVVGLPSLWLASLVVGLGLVTGVVGLAFVVLTVVALVVGLRSPLTLLVRILRESIPILCLAGLVSIVAGIAIEKRLATFSALPALLVLLPGHLSTAGALGGVLANRLSSKIHLGVVQVSALPGREARTDIVFVVVLAVPVFALNAAVAHVAAGLIGVASPGLADLVAASLMGGLMAVGVSVLIAYYGTVAAVRLGLDPDTYGVPMVSSSIDLAGAFSLILAIVALGIV